MLNKQNEPKIIPKLSDEHATNIGNNTPSPTPLYTPNTFEKRDSSSFKEQKILYQPNLMPEKKYESNVDIINVEPEVKEELKPVMDMGPKKLESEVKEMPSFTKSVSVNENMMLNPVEEVFNNAPVTKEEIKKEEKKEKVKKEKKPHPKWMKWIFIGILIEVLLILLILFIRNLNATETLECKAENYNDYYKANIVTVKKYTFKYGKIVSLVDTNTYIFDKKDDYMKFKQNNALPNLKISGRVVSFTVDDNNNTYEEKFNYDYKLLRKQNTSSSVHDIIVPAEENSPISLVDYNIKDIPVLFEGDFICR